jgi:hypothetical protein
VHQGHRVRGAALAYRARNGVEAWTLSKRRETPNRTRARTAKQRGPHTGTPEQISDRSLLLIGGVATHVLEKVSKGTIVRPPAGALHEQVEHVQLGVRHPMFAVAGGKQALDRTMTLAIEAAHGEVIELSVPDELGELVLKGAAYISDPRDRDRHLFDAAALAACITDHATERDRLKGSDNKRLRTLETALADHRHPAWLSLPEPARIAGQDTLRILTNQRGYDHH